MWWLLTLTYIFTVIRLWLRKSCPLCSVYSSGLIFFYIWHKWSLIIVGVSRVTFLQNLEIWIFGKFLKFFGLDIEKKSTVLDGFFPYLAQMITSMRGCVAYNDLWPWPIPSRLFGLCLENRVRSVAALESNNRYLYVGHNKMFRYYRS